MSKENGSCNRNPLSALPPFGSTSPHYFLLFPLADDLPAPIALRISAKSFKFFSSETLKVFITLSLVSSLLTRPPGPTTIVVVPACSESYPPPNGVATPPLLPPFPAPRPSFFERLLEKISSYPAVPRPLAWWWRREVCVRSFRRSWGCIML